MNRTLDVYTSTAASTFALGSGWFVTQSGRAPEKLLELYEFEACPFCRKVREALSTFDLDAMIHPCPKGGKNRSSVKERGGKERFPFLVDPNTGQQLYESADIIRYLSTTYRDGTVPFLLSKLTLPGSVLASKARPGKGRAARPSKPPEKPLELWNFEASPYCRIVREVLCELQITHVVHNVAKKSPRRKEFVERSGRMMVPYLADPNTGKEMFESADIAAYLNSTYAA